MRRAMNFFVGDPNFFAFEFVIDRTRESRTWTPIGILEVAKHWLSSALCFASSVCVGYDVPAYPQRIKNVQHVSKYCLYLGVTHSAHAECEMGSGSQEPARSPRSPSMSSNTH
jgi:hypothetical protein